jgi:hypothetical protein
MMSAAIMVAVGSACSRPTPDVAPNDPFASISAAPLPLASLSGANTLLLTVGALVFTDSAAGLGAERTSLLEAANAALDTALRRDAREVTWQGLPEQRRAVRRNPTMGVDPDRLPTAELVGSRVDAVPDPLWSQLRTLSALTGARYAVVPAAVQISGRPGAYAASYVLVAVDARTGQVAWRGRSTGRAAATPQAALALAAAAAAPSPIP